MANNNFKDLFTPKNVFIVLVVAYFIILNERKMYVNTGPDPATIEFQKYMIETNARIHSMERADSVHLQNVIDYAKQIIKNNGDVDGYDVDQLDSAFATLTNGG